jgi:general stress protein CsbA
MLRLIIKFVVIDYWRWIRLLLLLLKPAEAEEEYVGSYSIVLANSITLAKG